MRTTFIKTLEKLAGRNESIFLLTADLGFKLFDDFRGDFPDRFLNVGVAESNMVGIAAGMALSGKNVYCYSMVPFLTMRALDQIRVDLCYHKLNVKLIGVGGGLTYGLEGMTHHATEDLAIMRSLPNMTVVAPGDPLEAKGVVIESADYSGPLYIRLAGKDDPVVHKGNPPIAIGKGIVVHSGSDLSIFSTGTMLACANEVVRILKNNGIYSTLVSLHTVKPLDTDIILEQAAKTSAIFTIEEHSLIGGLGSAVAEDLLEAGYQGIFRRVALPDQYGDVIGRASYLRQAYGLTPEAISSRIMREVKTGLRVAQNEKQSKA